MNTTRFAVAAIVLALGCGRAGGPRVIRLAHGLDVNHPVHQAMEHMATRVAEASGGSLSIAVYPSEQLGSERECLELLQIGSVGMTKVSASVLESFAPVFEIFTLPYLFRDREHLFAVLEGPVGRDILLSAQPYRLRGLTYYDAGSRSFYTCDRPVRSPADLVGLKIRTQESASAMRMVRMLGAAATPISWGELYTALQQGVVDGAENNPPSFHLSHHYEVCKYYTLDEHTSVPDVLVISTTLWERLSRAQRKILEAAVRESAEVEKELWQKATEEALRAVAEAGVQILRPDKAAFADRVAAMIEEYRADPELGEWIDRVRAAAETAAPQRTGDQRQTNGGGGTSRGAGEVER